MKKPLLAQFPFIPSCIFLILSLGIFTAGYISFQNGKSDIKTEKYRELLAIAQLKIDQIVQWRQGIINEGNVLTDDIIITQRIDEFIKNPRSDQDKKEIFAWLSSQQKHYNYKAVFLLDAKGDMLFCVPETSKLLTSHPLESATEALLTKRTILSDFHRIDSFPYSQLDAFVPLLLDQGDAILPVGVLYFKIDPSNSIYPLIQSWPTPTGTGEVILVRREENDAVFLNQSRHMKNTPLAYRVPLTEEWTPTVRAVKGGTGIIESLDYRGVPVVAAALPVPDTPWFLIAKVDQEEMYAPIRRRMWYLALIVISSIIAAGTGTGLWWRVREIRHAQKIAEKELERSFLAERLEYLTKYANDAMFLTDEHFNIVECNERALFLYGYTRDELLKMNLQAIRSPRARLHLDDDISRVLERNGDVFETEHLRKDGDVIPVEVSSRFIAIREKKYFQSLVRDITERKKAEELLRRYEWQSSQHESSQVNKLRYRDPVQLNTNGTILDVLGKEVLQDIAEDLLKLLETCCAVHEKNGNYALGIVASGWCQFLDMASFKLCGTDDLSKALACGKWKCHESCWSRASKAAIEGGQPADIECDGGIRLYAVPIFADNEVIGSINFGYGDPPRGPQKQSEIAEKYGVSIEELRRLANAYKSRSTFIIDVAKNRLESAARLIGRIVAEHRQSETAIRRQATIADGLNRILREAVTSDTIEAVATSSLSVMEKLTGSAFGFIGEINKDGRFDTIAISNPGWDACTMPNSEATIRIKNMEIRGIDRLALRDGKSRIVNNPASHPDYVGTPDGHPPITSFLGVPFRDDGRTIGLVGLANKKGGYDLPDQEAVEKLSLVFVESLRHKRSQIALLESEVRYRKFVDTATNYVYSVILEDGKEVSSSHSPTCFAVTGYTAEEYDADPQLWYKMIFEEDRHMVMEHVHEVLSGKSVPHFEHRIYHKDGSIRWVRNTPLLVFNEQGELVRCDGFITDITDEKKLSAQLFQAQKMEAIGTMAAGVAHDFNNILTAIQGGADLATMKVDKADPLQRYLQDIRFASARAANLTRQLLLFSRKQPRVLTLCNLNLTVGNLLKMLHRIIGEDIVITTDFKADLWTIQADVGSIEQVIMNLAVNARDAMTEGGQITIKTENVQIDKKYCKTYTYARPGKFVLLSVEDTGSGMDKETVKHIFEPFFTTKEIGKGTGLGLAVVYGIVKQHEGWINVYSEPGSGTSFKIYLPAFSKVQEIETEETVLLEKLQGNRERILFVEDDEAVRTVASEAMNTNGYIVFTAKNVEEAIVIFEREKGAFDLLFTDVVLPDKNGLQLIEQLLHSKSDLHVLVCSGYTDHKSQWLVIQERKYRFLWKPYTIPDLLKTLKDVLASAA